MNTVIAQENMIKSQLRTWSVLDPKIIEVAAKVDRQAFCPKSLKDFAYMDEGFFHRNTYTLAPKTVFRMLQASKIQSKDSVLEIGTGFGYVTALLTFLAEEVTSLYFHKDSLKVAREGFEAIHRMPPLLKAFDAKALEESTSLYDVIFINGAVCEIPDYCVRLLKNGGRIIAIEGKAPNMEAVCLHKLNPQTLSRESLFETNIPYLPSFEARPEFIF